MTHQYFKEAEAAAELAPRKKSHTSAVLLAVAVVCAGGAIYAMRSLGLNAGMDISGLAIAYDTKPSEDLDNEYDRVLEDLGFDVNAIQVPLSNLREDPFELRRKETPVFLTNPDDNDRIRQRKLEAFQRERANNIKVALEKLKLQSTLGAGGSRPLARINGDLVTIDKPVGTYFTVRDIRTHEVDLVADGEVYTIKMQLKQNDTNRIFEPGESVNADLDPS